MAKTGRVVRVVLPTGPWIPLCLKIHHAAAVAGSGPSLARTSIWAHTFPVAPLANEPDPVTLSLLNAPEDDEPETEEELRAIEETRAYLRSGGKLIPHEEVERAIEKRLADEE